MKTKTWQLLIAIAFLPAAGSVAQTNFCATSNKLVCAFPASGNVLAQQTLGFLPNGSPAFQAASNAAFTTALSINSAVAAQLTQLPIPSATVGVISIKRKGSDVPVPFNNLGPILTDRPDTVGRGHIFVGFNYQHFNFNALDGNDLGSLEIAFSAVDPASTPDPHIRYGSMINKARFKLDQYVFIATAGITPRTDVSVIVPVNSVDLKVNSSGFKYYDFDIQTSQYSAHIQAPNQSVTSTGTVTGLGDVIVGIKQLLLGQDRNRPAAAAGVTLRFPTGQSLNYLGSGALGGTLYGLIEYRARVAPHFKISYAWNDSSKVLNLNNQEANIRLPGGIQYAVGADFKAFKPLTLSFDLLGSQFVNSPYFTLSKNNAFVPVPPATSGVPNAYDVVLASRNTYTTFNVSGGIKYSPFRSLVLYANALAQANNVGLRSDVVPLVGIAYNFSKRSD